MVTGVVVLYSKWHYLKICIWFSKIQRFRTLKFTLEAIHLFVLRSFQNASLYWLLILLVIYLYNLIWLQRWLKYTFSEAIHKTTNFPIYEKFIKCRDSIVKSWKLVLRQRNYVSNLIGAIISLCVASRGLKIYKEKYSD